MTAGHPIVRIVFTFPDGDLAERLWYHVPRVGEGVQLGGRAAYVVERLYWDEANECIYVRLA